MRRLAAILAAAWVSFLLIGPVVFAAGSQPELAACCRRNGQHHCAARSTEQGSGAGLRAAKCPLFPSAKVLPVQRHAAGLPATPAVLKGLGVRPAVKARTRTLWRISHDRSAQKRGPPLFLL
jgi:hypothetical protein